MPAMMVSKVNSDHRSKFSNLSNGKEEAWKYQSFNGIRTRDLRDTSAIWISYIYFTSFHCTRRYELNKLTSFPMCGFSAQVEHRTGIAEVTGSNPVEAPDIFRLLPSNCLN